MNSLFDFVTQPWIKSPFSAVKRNTAGLPSETTFATRSPADISFRAGSWFGELLTMSGANNNEIMKNMNSFYARAILTRSDFQTQLAGSNHLGELFLDGLQFLNESFAVLLDDGAGKLAVVVHAAL